MGSDYDPKDDDFDFEFRVRSFFDGGNPGDAEHIAHRIHNDDSDLPKGLVKRVEKTIKTLVRKKLLRRVYYLTK